MGVYGDHWKDVSLMNDGWTRVYEFAYLRKRNMAGKPNKSILKRFKITSRGKFFRRPAGLNHFNARALGGVMRAKRRKQQLSSVDKKLVKQHLYLA